MPSVEDESSQLRSVDELKNQVRPSSAFSRGNATNQGILKVYDNRGLRSEMILLLVARCLPDQGLVGLDCLIVY